MVNVDELHAAILSAFDARIAIAVADKGKGSADALERIKTASTEAENALHDELVKLAGHISALEKKVSGDIGTGYIRGGVR